MDKKPLFSLVLPTRNRALLVQHCLACIAQQDFENFEVILSDNGSTELCENEFSAYAVDRRFRYVRPPHDMNMSDHWEFALSFATGTYITIVSEKFMFRPDALSVLAKVIAKNEPDLLTWQFERYEVVGDDFDNGHYHPLMKPVASSFYDPMLELKRRFSFATPSFYRPLRHKNSYGKIYSGCVRNEVLDRVRSHFGRVFSPYIPDFSSMAAILNESSSAIDVGQSLMMVVFADNISNGDATKISLAQMENYFASYGEDADIFSRHTLFEGCWVGHNSFIAYDYDRIKIKARYGHLVTTEIDKVNLLSWMLADFYEVKDFGHFDKSQLEKILMAHKYGFSAREQLMIDRNLEMLKNAEPCPYEIYHSGLDKLQSMPADMTPRTLARYHWLDKTAPPRKNVLQRGEGIPEAVQYFYHYNLASIRLLEGSAEKMAQGYDGNS
ncbi:glycosyltransferase family 2 protein [Rheinheimera faecalis]|jgi:glycosyltransferase involved in cell wall biosynthesis|uniref:glycosyltransferase family 2 protein n=1 Tax=Rheinheimera faecalis TaxID=2901141 RepID=UPI001E5DD345|nr:glycosyltransferase family 2 protein [Rheinheimera faecalis]